MPEMPMRGLGLLQKFRKWQNYYDRKIIKRQIYQYPNFLKKTFSKNFRDTIGAVTDYELYINFIQSNLMLYVNQSRRYRPQANFEEKIFCASLGFRVSEIFEFYISVMLRLLKIFSHPSFISIQLNCHLGVFFQNDISKYIYFHSL